MWKTIKRNGNKINIQDSNKDNYVFKPLNINTNTETIDSFTAITNIDFSKENTTIMKCSQKVDKDLVTINCTVNTPKSIQNNSINVTLNNVSNYTYVIGFGMVATVQVWRTTIGFKIYENGEYIGFVGSNKPKGWDDTLNLQFFQPYWTYVIKRAGAYLWSYECSMYREFKKSKNLNLKFEFYTENVNRPNYEVLVGMFQVTDNMISYPINHRVITMSKFKD